MSDISLAQSKKLKNNQKKSTKKANKPSLTSFGKIQQPTLSTLCTRNSSESHLKKLKDTKQKSTNKKQRTSNKKHMKKLSEDNKLALELVENHPIRYLSEQPEDFISFREYYMIEGKWIPYFKQQRLKVHKEKQTQSAKVGSQAKAIEKYSAETETISKSFSNCKLNPTKRIADLFTQLELEYLPKSETFKAIPAHLKENYVQLLNTIMSKIRASEQSSRTAKSNHELSPIKQLQAPEKIENKIEEEKQLYKIYTRECKQMGILSEQGSQGIDTSLNKITLIIDQLFALIQAKFQREIIENLKVIHGYKKLTKLSNLLRGLSIERDEPVIPYQIYHLMEKQIEDEDVYTQIHTSCIIDAIDDELKKFKPFYESEGECFPWSLKIVPSLTFYEINEKSLEIVLVEVRKRVLEYACTLCGLFVNGLTYEESIQLEMRRMEREDMMFRRELQGLCPNKEELQMQMESTLTLMEVADKVEACLLDELLSEMR